MRTQVRIFKSCNLCPDSYRSRWSGMAFHSFLQRRSAPRKMVHLPSLSDNSIYSITVKSVFYDRSRMTGRYLVPLCKNRLFVSAHACPFRRLTPPPFPCAGTAFISYAFLFRQKLFTASRKRNSLLPSFLSGGQNTNDDERKNII